MSDLAFWIGADIGGTFTDLFVIDPVSGACRTGKVLTDHADPTNSIIDGLRLLAIKRPSIWRSPSACCMGRPW